MLAVVNSLLGGPLKHVLLWVPLGSIYGILLGWSREVMVTMGTYNYKYTNTVYNGNIMNSVTSLPSPPWEGCSFSATYGNLLG